MANNNLINVSRGEWLSKMKEIKLMIEGLEIMSDDVNLADHCLGKIEGLEMFYEWLEGHL